jgi:hypothetical protein
VVLTAKTQFPCSQKTASEQQKTSCNMPNQKKPMTAAPWNTQQLRFFWFLQKKKLHFFWCRLEVNQCNAPIFVSSRGAYINNNLKISITILVKFMNSSLWICFWNYHQHGCVIDLILMCLWRLISWRRRTRYSINHMTC